MKISGLFTLISITLFTAKAFSADCHEVKIENVAFPMNKTQYIKIVYGADKKTNKPNLVLYQDLYQIEANKLIKRLETNYSAQGTCLIKNDPIAIKIANEVSAQQILSQASAKRTTSPQKVTSQAMKPSQNLNPQPVPATNPAISVSALSQPKPITNNLKTTSENNESTNGDSETNEVYESAQQYLDNMPAEQKAKVEAQRQALKRAGIDYDPARAPTSEEMDQIAQKTWERLSKRKLPENVKAQIKELLFSKELRGEQ